MTNEFKHPMNVVAKDTVSGFQGLIIMRTAHLFGCAQYGLAPQELSSDGTPQRTQYFDEARIEILDNSKAAEGPTRYNQIFSISLGTEVKDKVSNFQGKVLVISESLHNCSQYYVEPPVDDKGKPSPGEWFDEGRLDVVGQGIDPEDVAAPKRGSVFSRDLPNMR